MGQGPRCILHGRRTEGRLETIPGPGAYTPNMKSVMERFPAIARCTGPRVEKDFSTRKDVPGPGNYSSSSTLNGPKFGFGSSGMISKSDRARANAPGPGAYKLPCTFAQVAGYLLPDRRDDFKYV